MSWFSGFILIRIGLFWIWALILLAYKLLLAKVITPLIWLISIALLSAKDIILFKSFASTLTVVFSGFDNGTFKSSVATVFPAICRYSLIFVDIFKLKDQKKLAETKINEQKWFY